MNWQNILDLLHREMATGVVANSLARLVVAAVLGGIIGLERELRHRPAGLRTNMFICFGAALFTILSDVLAVEHLGDHTRISAQIIPGIGFIGAGSILHTRGLTTGLTTASTLFVVASVGMATGWRPLPDRNFCHRGGFNRSVFARPPGAELQLKDSPDQLRSNRCKRGGNYTRDQPHPGAQTSHDAKRSDGQHEPARPAAI